MIEIKDVSKKYGSHLALDHINLQFRPGKVTGLIGPNGAGKSTLLRCITNIDTFDGEILINGVPNDELLAPFLEIGALLDTKTAHPSLRAYDYLRILGATHGISDENFDHRITKLLVMAGLGRVSNRRIKTFSLGMYRRLGIAAALVGSPNCVLFDEPVNGLDSDGIKWVHEICQYLAQSGKTVIISSHLINQLENAIDDVAIIGQGKVLYNGTKDEFMTKNTGKSFEGAYLETIRGSVDYVGIAGIEELLGGENV